jgi:putative hydrolase of the HAD superfamily
MPIKCVFFDFDGVLRTWHYDEQRFQDEFGIPIEAFREVAFAKEHVNPAIRGHVTNEEWRAGVGEVLKERYPADKVDAAIADWNQRNGKLIPEVLAIADECKVKLPVALFTNATTRLPWEMEQHGLTGYFDYVVNASDTGFVKPEPEIYEYAANLAGIEHHEAFFTDDGVAQVEGARKLGWTAHHFKNADGLRAALVEAGVLA